MKKWLLILLCYPLYGLSQPPNTTLRGRWENRAAQVTIIRDNWGIPHVYGKTDADAVFGLIYAQCEDDFKRVELNYIEKLGRMAEVKGESELPNDLYIRLVIDSAEAKKDFEQSPDWLKDLLQAWADGINYYLYKHPEVKPLLLDQFMPWYPLLWTDGSIGAISTGDVTEEETWNFYTGQPQPLVRTKPVFEEEQTGSNGFAITPMHSATGNALLYINPHVTFYFRPEVHMVSEEGTNVYGAVTWGQFFIYQGFNAWCGWMHTSSNVDVADLYAEKVTKENNILYYEYDKKQILLTQKPITLRYTTPQGIREKEITAFFTHHGPVMARRDGKWIAVKANNRSMNGLMQSWLRTKSKGYSDYKKVMQLRSNTSNNTVFADNRGNIAYWHGNFVPRRDARLNWSKPVDGSTSATEWKGLHTLNQIVHINNPGSGWIQNCNSTPFTASGSSSPLKSNYPNYMAPDGENFRGINAVQVLSRTSKFTLEQLIAAGYDTKLCFFEVTVPALVASFEKNVPPGDSLYNLLKEPIAILKQWDYHSGSNSIATTLAVHWAERLTASLQRVYIDEGWDDQVTLTRHFAATATKEELLPPLAAVIKDLQSRFGKWDIAWGEVNRYQRITGDIVQPFSDAAASTPVPFASAAWGMLPSYNSKEFPGTRKRYGVSGNSFICAVEFGPRIRAKSLLAGGESGSPSSPHFADQLEMYTTGRFKDVLFYKEDVLKHAERSYHPGQ